MIISKLKTSDVVKQKKENNTQSDPYRLVTSLPDELNNLACPLHYHLHLFLPELDSTVTSFEGYVCIALRILKNTSNLALHADPQYLNVRAGAINISSEKWIPILSSEIRHNLGVEGHVIEIPLPSMVKSGTNVQLLLVFEGVLGESPQGLYHSCSLFDPRRLSSSIWRLGTEENKSLKQQENESTEKKGTKELPHESSLPSTAKVIRTIASSLEPLFSRRLFPCYDTLHLKAAFTVAVSFPMTLSLSSDLPPVQVVSSCPAVTSISSECPPIFPCLGWSVPFSEDTPKVKFLSTGPNSLIYAKRNQLFRNCRWKCCSVSDKNVNGPQPKHQYDDKVKVTQNKPQDDQLEKPSNRTITTTNRASRRASSVSTTDSVSAILPQATNERLILSRQRFSSSPSCLTRLLHPVLVTKPPEPPDSQLTLRTIPQISTDFIRPQKTGTVNIDEMHSVIDDVPHGDGGFRIARVGEGPNIRLHAISPSESSDSLGESMELTALVYKRSRSDDEKGNGKAIRVQVNEEKENSSQGLYRTTLFETTPMLPCYALEVCLGHFIEYAPPYIGHVERKSRPDEPEIDGEINGCHRSLLPIKIRVLLVPPYDWSSSEYAVWIAQRCLEVLENYWNGALYPINKLDLIPLPTHRGLGLENFGCITFDDRYFFVDFGTHRHRALRVARLLCHEISHMWIGDLLTPPSFNELWLKEGFARFIEYCILLHIFPAPSFAQSQLSSTVKSDNSYLNNTIGKPSTSLLELLNHFQFSASDIWGSFVFEVFWDSLAADSQQIEYSSALLRHGSNRLRKSAKLYGRAITSTGTVTGKGIRFYNTIRRMSMKKSSKSFQTQRMKWKRHTLHKVPDPEPIQSPDLVLDTLPAKSSIVSPFESRESEHMGEILMNKSLRPSSHPIQLEGLLKTEDIMEKFDSITYGKAACVLYSISEFVGGSKIFFEVVHRILKRNLSSTSKQSSLLGGSTHRRSSLQPCLKPQGIFVKSDFWDSVAAVCSSPSYTPENRLFLTHQSPKLTSRFIEALYDPWLTNEGFPRIAISMDSFKIKLKPILSFVVKISLTQIIDPKQQLRDFVDEPVRKKTFRKSVTIGGSMDKKSIQREGNKERNDDRIQSIDTINILTVPLVVTVDNKEEFGILVRNETIEIQIERSFGEIAGEGPSNGIQLRINPSASTFCTIHPQDGVTWDALFNSVRTPSVKYQDCDISILLITILEDSRYLLGLIYSGVFKRRTTKGREKLLNRTLNLLFTLYESICQRLKKIATVDSKTSDTEKVPVLYPRPSHTLLAVLQLIFTTFDWVIKAAVPRVTLTDHDNLVIATQCEKMLEAEICPAYVLQVCQEYSELCPHLLIGTKRALFSIPFRLGVNRTAEWLAKPIHVSTTDGLKNNDHSKTVVATKNQIVPTTNNAFVERSHNTMNVLDNESGVSTGETVVGSIKNSITEMSTSPQTNSSVKDYLMSSSPEALQNCISGEKLYRAMKELELAPPSAVQHARSIIGLLLESDY